MTNDLEKKVLEYIEVNYRKFINILSDLVSIETVSAWKDNSVMTRGAEVVATFLRDIGLKLKFVVMGVIR